MTELLIIHGVPGSGTSILGQCLRGLGVQSLNDLVQLKSYTIHEVLFQELNCPPFMIGSLPDGWINSTAGELAKERLGNLFMKLPSHYENVPFYIEDPCIARFLSLWNILFKESDIIPKFIQLIRHPWEVATSLKAKFCISFENAHLFWLQYLKDSISVNQNYSAAQIYYDQLIFDPFNTLSYLKVKLDIDWPNDLYDYAKDLMSFVQPSFRQIHPSNMTANDKEQFAVYYKTFDEIKHKQFKEVLSQNSLSLFDNLCNFIGRKDMKHAAYLAGTSNQTSNHSESLYASLVCISNDGTQQFNENTALSLDKWKHTIIELPDNVSANGTEIQFKPVNSPGTVIISAINLVKKADGSVVWSANQENDFERLSIDPEIIRVPDPENLHLISLSGCPSIRLSKLENIKHNNGPLIFEAWIKVHIGTESLRQYLIKIEDDISDLESRLTAHFMKEINSLKNIIKNEKARYIHGLAYRDSQGHLPKNYLIMLTLHRCGSTFLMDAIRTHPDIYLEPRALLQENLSLIAGRYPVDLTTDSIPYLDIEQRPGIGCRVPILGSKQKRGPILSQISDESYAIEKIHPEFFGYNAIQFIDEIGNFANVHSTNFRFIYLIRDPKSTISSFIKYKRRNPAWYRQVSEDDVFDFFYKEFSCLLELIQKNKGLILDYSSLINNFDSTLHLIFDYLWPGKTGSNYDEIIQQAKSHTDRRVRLVNSATPFLGPEAGSVEGGDKDLDNYFIQHKESIDQLFQLYRQIRQFME